MKNCKVSQRACGFTLIELLVVIAIITLIAAILFPVFSQAREKARAATCTSNLKQLGLAFLQYSQDFDEELPCGADGAGDASGWASPLFSYTKSAGVFVCPDDLTNPQTRIVLGKAYSLKPVSYAYNIDVGADGNGISVDCANAKLISPAKTVLLYEVTAQLNPVPADAGTYNVADLSTPNETGGGYNGTDDCYSPSGTGELAFNAWNTLQQATGWTGGSGRSIYFNTTAFTGQYGRHGTGSNYLACDGHVKFLQGSSVSTGNYYGLAPNATTPTTKQDQLQADQAAGTQAAQTWTLTFSPV